jgi:hypothetical protein
MTEPSKESMMEAREIFPGRGSTWAAGNPLRNPSTQHLLTRERVRQRIARRLDHYKRMIRDKDESVMDAYEQRDEAVRLLREVMKFSISPTFDAKASYSKRKAEELTGLQRPIRAFLATLEADDAK